MDAMDTEAALKVAGALVMIGSSVVALVSYWRSDRAAFLASAKIFALYALHCALGLALVLFLIDAPKPPEKALALTAFLLAWIVLGALWMARSVPRYRELPRWMGERWGTIDHVVAGIAAVALAAYFV